MQNHAKKSSLWGLLLMLLSFVLPSVVACEGYVAPPEPSIDGLRDGVLGSPSAALRVRFSKPVDQDSVRVKVIKYATDTEGNLGDETTDPELTLDVLASHDPVEGDVGVQTSFAEDDTVFELLPKGAFPVGSKLALIVEPGLRSKGGVDTRVRRTVLFAYNFSCSGKGTKVLTSGLYSAILDVEEPIGVQLQLFADLRVDATTGRVRAQFTNADRNPDNSRCKTVSCSALEACRTLPEEQCVAKSLRAASADEWPDFVPNVAPPTGYSFTVEACAEDQADGTAALGSAPVNVAVQSPPVTIRALTLIASFKKDADGSLAATGGVTAGDISLGASGLGSGKGTMKVKQIPAGKAPSGIPGPP
jgi:hypothetical protein